MKKSNGITLIALVITIIVLLILAGVSIATLTGENGILNQAAKAGEETKNATEKEQLNLACVAVIAENEAKGITKGKLEEELKKYDDKIKVEDKDGDIVVTFPSENEYTVGKDGTIEGPTITMEEAKKKEKFDTKTKVKDTLGNIVVIPEGFKIAEDSALDVTQGVVIEDVENEATAGSQFVWIPVGTIYKNELKETETINLSRYTFADGENDKDENGITLAKGKEINQGEKAIIAGSYNYIETLEKNGTEEKGYNAVADEEVFKAFTNKLEEGSSRKSVEEVGGYYIGRYEARTEKPLSDQTSVNAQLPQITVNGNDDVYIYAKQMQASKVSKEMYQGKSFKSDLMNSYAWDTAIVYIQKFSGDKDYSRQNSLNDTNDGFKEKGTKELEKEKQDERCKIWDMASNCYEWTTETFSNTERPCVLRGGDYLYSIEYTGVRFNNITNYGNNHYGFRPILIL